MRTLLHDLRYAARRLSKAPGFTAVAVVTLALGLGATTSNFSVVNSVLLQPLPYDDGRELVLLEQQNRQAGMNHMMVSVQELEDYRARSRTLEKFVEYHSLWFTLFDGTEPQRVQSGVVSWNFFQTMGIRPILGRAFLPSEDAEGAEPVLILSYDYWQTQFGGDPGVIGRTVGMNDQIHTIVGVLPDDLPEYPGRNDVWMPWYACPWRTGDHWQEDRAMRPLTVFARLGAGVTIQQARNDVGRIARKIQAEHPAAYPDDASFGATLTPLRTELTEEARPVFLILLGMGGLVLLIACANVTNLTLARMSGRGREMSIRTSLGASRGRLMRQLVTESTALALVGGAVGLLIAFGAVDLFAALARRFTPRAAEVEVNGWVIAFTLAASLVAGVSIGMISALLHGRNVAGSLREGGGHATSAAGPRRLRRVLVAGQLAVTLVLLVGAGLMLRSFAKLQRVDPGFEPDNVLTMQIDLDWSTYMGNADRREFYRSLLEKTDRIPGVMTAALAGTIPLGGGLPTSEFLIEGIPVPASGQRPQTEVQIVSTGYFKTLRIPLLRGRMFTAGDNVEAPQVALINQSLAQRYWGRSNPIGARISSDGETWITVVGVVGNVKQEGLASEFPDQVYLALAQNSPIGVNLLVRTTANPLSIARQATEAVYSIDSRQPVAFVQTMNEVRSDSISSRRLTTLLVGFFAAVALVISIAGIAGMIAFTVSQRTREFGVRIALGADGGSVVWMVVRQGMVLILVSLAVGAAGALALTRFIAGWLYDVPPTDPLTFLLVSLLLATTAAVAAYIPARRATRVDPMAALRSE